MAALQFEYAHPAPPEAGYSAADEHCPEPPPANIAVQPLILTYAGVANARLGSSSTAAVHLSPLTDSLRHNGYPVERPHVLEKFGVVGDMDREHAKVSKITDRRLARHQDKPVLPVLVGHSAGGLFALAEYLRLKAKGIDCGVAVICSPLEGTRGNPFARGPLNPIAHRPLSYLDLYTKRDKAIRAFARPLMERLLQRNDNDDVLLVGTTMDWFSPLHSMVPDVPGARKLIIARSGETIKGYDDVRKLRVDPISHLAEHAIAPCRQELANHIGGFVTNLVRKKSLQPARPAQLQSVS